MSLDLMSSHVRKPAATALQSRALLASLLLSGIIYSLGGGVELNPTIMVLGSFDWLPDAGGSSRCIESVRRAVAAAGGSRLNFVATMYWRDSFPSDGGIDSFCYKDKNMQCSSIDDAAIQSFRAGMQECFQAAVDLGMDISVVPHLDDSAFQRAWRNGLIFNPTTKYAGYSYEDVLLTPLADALGSVMTPTTRVWMAMQGEMSATVCRYPNEYVVMHQKLRTRIAEMADGAPATRLKHIKIGVSLNFNKLDAGNDGMQIGPVVSLLLGRPRLERPKIEAAKLVRLFETVDFVGISSYAALTSSFKEDELQKAAVLFFAEISKLGIDLATIMRSHDTELQYTEFGIGGGTAQGGRVRAWTADQAASTPFYGIWGAYTPLNDPWTWPPVRDFMHSYYARALNWLSRGGGPTHHISACFLWDLGSWDVLGVYPDSTNTQGSYRDAEVASMVRLHNDRVCNRTLALAPRRRTGPDPPVVISMSEPL